MSLQRNVRRLVLGAGRLIWLSLFVLPFGFPPPVLAQSPQPQIVQREVTNTFDSRETGASAGEPNANCRATSAERCLINPEPSPSVLKCDLRAMTNPQHRRYCQATMGNSLLPICPLAPFS